MKKLKALFFIMIILFSLKTVGQISNRESLVHDFEDIVSKINFSGSILISENGKTIYNKAFGKADIEDNIYNKIDTKYNYASMGKMFTGVAIMQLVEKGKLSLSDKLIDIIPDYPNKEVAKKVSIHHLLTHTSGITGMYQMQSDTYLSQHKDYLPLFVNDKLSFEPGEQMVYSNAGYLVLGLIIEKISKQTYFDYVQKNIFEPAKMCDTGFDLKINPPNNLAINYTSWRSPNSDKIEPVDYGHDGFSGGGGYSTVQDFSKFAKALMDFKLLNKKTTQTLLKGYSDGRGLGKYSYGFTVNNIYGLNVAGHGGGAPGANGELLIFLDQKISIVVLSNQDPHNSTFIKDAFTGLILREKKLLPKPILTGDITFQLEGYADAKVVTIQGAFTDGNKFKYPLKFVNGKWITKINLPRGKHLYRFIVDGVSIHDKTNPLEQIAGGGLIVSEINIK